MVARVWCVTSLKMPARTHIAHMSKKSFRTHTHTCNRTSHVCVRARTFATHALIINLRKLLLITSFHLFLGRKLWVVKIATEKNRPDLKPMVKYLANMHGNEAVGKELMIGLIEYLAETYKNGSNPEITQLVSTMDIHLMPSMNPDGFENSSIGFCTHSPTGRHNMNDVDLNRNFPTWDHQNITDVMKLYKNR